VRSSGVVRSSDVVRSSCGLLSASWGSTASSPRSQASSVRSQASLARSQASSARSAAAVAVALVASVWVGSSRRVDYSGSRRLVDLPLRAFLGSPCKRGQPERVSASQGDDDRPFRGCGSIPPLNGLSLFVRKIVAFEKIPSGTQASLQFICA